MGAVAKFVFLCSTDTIVLSVLGMFVAKSAVRRAVGDMSGLTDNKHAELFLHKGVSSVQFSRFSFARVSALSPADKVDF